MAHQHIVWSNWLRIICLGKSNCLGNICSNTTILLIYYTSNFVIQQHWRKPHTCWSWSSSLPTEVQNLTYLRHVYRKFIGKITIAWQEHDNEFSLTKSAASNYINTERGGKKGVVFFSDHKCITCAWSDTVILNACNVMHQQFCTSIQKSQRKRKHTEMPILAYSPTIKYFFAWNLIINMTWAIW